MRTSTTSSPSECRRTASSTENTILPDAAPGEAGTAIVSGHRDTHFAVLQELIPGDALFVEGRDGRVLRYVVDELVVADSRTTQVGATDDASTLILITCWPFDALHPGGPLRYVVSARASQEAHPWGTHPQRSAVDSLRAAG